MSQERHTIPKEDQWNVNALYLDLDAWEQAFDNCSSQQQSPHWPEIQPYKGKLKESAETVKKALDLLFFHRAWLHYQLHRQ